MENDVSAVGSVTEMYGLYGNMLNQVEQALIDLGNKIQENMDTK